MSTGINSGHSGIPGVGAKNTSIPVRTAKWMRKERRSDGISLFFFTDSPR
jgi:hypothetical protein